MTLSAPSTSSGINKLTDREEMNPIGEQVALSKIGSEPGKSDGGSAFSSLARNVHREPGDPLLRFPIKS